MKKLLVLSLFLGLMGSAYALEKVDITTGVYMESENHNAEYNSSDVTVHGVRAKLDFKDFPLWTEFAYEYRNADSLSGHQGDEDRYKFMLGSRFNAGDFSFRPEYELRVGDKRESPEKNVGHRFKPNWGYKFNDQWSLFNGWLFAYEPNKAYRGYSETKTWDDYYHEIETGLKFKFADDQAVAFGFYNEYKKEEKSDMYQRAKKFDEWQIRLAYEKKFDNGILVSPFARITVSQKEEAKEGYDIKSKGKGRYGVKMGYAADNGLGVYGETYYQNEPREVDGHDQSDKNRFFLKLGVDYTF